MTITIGMWVIPLILTIIFFIGAWIKTPPPQGFLGNAIESLVYNVMAIIASLIVWLIYALLT